MSVKYSGSISKHDNKGKIATAAILAAGILASSIGGNVLAKKQNNYSLPTKDQVIDNMEYLQVNEYDKSFLSIKDNEDAQVYRELKNDYDHTYVTRFAMPANGSAIKVNVFIKNLSDFRKNCFINMIENENLKNEILENGYKYELNFNPTIFDLFASSINYFSYDFGKDYGTKGQTFCMFKKNNKAYDITRSIVLISNNITDVQCENTFTHEFEHAAEGRGDAYLQQKILDSSNCDYYINSIMNNIDISTGGLTLLDITHSAILTTDLSTEDAKNNFDKLIETLKNNGFATYRQKLSANAKSLLLNEEILKERLKELNYSVEDDFTVAPIDTTLYSIVKQDVENGISFSLNKYTENGYEKQQFALINTNNSNDNIFGLPQNDANLLLSTSKTVSTEEINIKESLYQNEPLCFRYGNYVINYSALYLTTNHEISEKLVVENVITERQYNLIKQTIEKINEDYSCLNSKDFTQSYLGKTFNEIFFKTTNENNDENVSLANKIENGYNLQNNIKIRFNFPQEEELTR